jgi:hypothetical protein
LRAGLFLPLDDERLRRETAMDKETCEMRGKASENRGFGQGEGASIQRLRAASGARRNRLPLALEMLLKKSHFRTRNRFPLSLEML